MAQADGEPLAWRGDSDRRSSRGVRRRRSLPEVAVRGASPARGASMSAPRSKRNEASVDSANRLLVRRTETGSNHALSKATRVVPAVTSESAPPMTPAHRLWPGAVGDDEHVDRQLPLDAVQGADAFSFPRAPDSQLAACEPVEIERVHGVAELDQHVVRDVDDVVDRTDFGRFEPRRHPRRRRADRHLRHRRRVPRAECAGVLRDRHRQLIVAGRGRCRGRPGHVPSVDGRHLAGDTGHAQAVGPVGRDLEIEYRVLAPGRAIRDRRRRLDGRHLEPVRGERLGQLVHAHRDGDELTQPGNQDSQ